MNRRFVREEAFKVLFQTDVGRNPWQEVLPRTIKELELSENLRDFLEQLVKGTIGHLKEIDADIEGLAQGWKLDRMANTDRNILRIAIYEIKYMSDIPEGVSVNEAVELAKKYGDTDSGKFVNGILGNLVRSLNVNKGEKQPE